MNHARVSHPSLNDLKNKGLYRELKTVSSEQGPEIYFKGRKLINFSSNNYLGLANHPLLKKSAIEAIEKYGIGSGASRLITGSMLLHQELEDKIALFKGTEKALLFNSGYHANIGVIPSLVGERDFIFSDELNHASLIDGCRLSKAKTHVYRHNDMGELEEMLNSPSAKQPADRHPPQRLIITDTVFSMDGDLCHLPKIMELAEKYEALVFLDEAHATGIFGKKGRGVVEHYGIKPDHPRIVQMGTLGKALGSFGAYVCGSSALVEWLINKSRSFIYTTALPPPVAAAGLAALNLISEDPSHRENLLRNVRYFRSGLKKIGYDRLLSPYRQYEEKAEGGISPIFPLIFGSAEKTMNISEALFEKGIWAHGIRPPTVPEETSRIRLTIMATHTKDHLDGCLSALETLELLK